MIFVIITILWILSIPLCAYLADKMYLVVWPFALFGPGAMIFLLRWYIARRKAGINDFKRKI